MRIKVRIHYDNAKRFRNPQLWVWTEGTGSIEKELNPAGRDDYGVYYDLAINRSSFNFKFKDRRSYGTMWEDDSNNRYYSAGLGNEIWCRAKWHNIYNVKPAQPVGDIRDMYEKIKDLIPEQNFYLPQTDVSRFDTPSLLGAHKLKDGSISFALFHPRAGRVYLGSNINQFKTPGHCQACSLEQDKFIALDLYNGYYGEPNIWWTRIAADMIGDVDEVEYRFYVQGGTGGIERFVHDPYTRVYSLDKQRNNCIVVDPTTYQWHDEEWNTPDMGELIIYELNVYGFTDNDSDIPLEDQSTFRGIIKRIKDGYFNDLGITALALMPTSEAWSSFGLGYDPCSFMSVEQDFGTPDDLRELVDTAHQHGLAVIIDQVFNHTSNQFNPLWNLIDDGSQDGGFYFSGNTQWGNRLATGKDEVDNMLIDSCKLFIKEYHVDGFRFDATHTYFMDHKLLYELQEEIRDDGFKNDVIMIAENLPNQSDLNFDGYNGYAQWCDMFHDKIKALLREGVYRNCCDDSPHGLGDIFYFSKNQFATHTNNVVNYSESHDEPSVKFEVETNNILDCNIKDRKARLAMLATMTALGQPMIYMGQEFGVNREANSIDLNKVAPDPNCGSYNYNEFYRWTQGLINLRKKYKALRITGSAPINNGKFKWMIGPWLAKKQGQDKKVIGWQTKDLDSGDKMLILLNFDSQDVDVELQFNSAGSWIKLADIDQVNDLSREEFDSDNMLRIKENLCFNFTLPSYSGFIYKKQ